MEEKFEIDAKTIVLVERAFLPLNPNKLRNAGPDVKEAARRFKKIAEKARIALSVAEPGRW